MTTMIRKNRDKTQQDLVRDSQKFLFVKHLWEKKKDKWEEDFLYLTTRLSIHHRSKSTY